MQEEGLSIASLVVSGVGVGVSGVGWMTALSQLRKVRKSNEAAQEALANERREQAERTFADLVRRLGEIEARTAAAATDAGDRAGAASGVRDWRSDAAHTQVMLGRIGYEAPPDLPEALATSLGIVDVCLVELNEGVPPHEACHALLLEMSRACRLSGQLAATMALGALDGTP
jgi:hypothetical protein